MIYDVIIIGGGPAGLTAALYAARLGLGVLVISKEIGGQANYIITLENYPGFESISGVEFIEKVKKQLENLNVKIVKEEVVEIKKKEKEFIVKTKKKKYLSKVLILALGRKSKKLGVKDEEKFIGKGISYCAVCDAPLFTNKRVAVVGSGNAAISTALLLSKFAKKVYLITKYKPSELKVEKIKLEKLKQKGIEIIQAKIEEIKGKNFVEGILLDTGSLLEVDGLFVEIGKVPSTEIAREFGVKMDDEGYIITNDKKETSVEGVFAAGDCTNNSLKQVITACAEGAIAAKSAYDFLKSKKF
ncbi:MAG: FAD-dependent oxidoreductase [Candidatus Pacearchaeota archaeon]|nr:FAD-dependent oxidoreductase [Candidatus Pacearchaeota archaeon]